MYLDIVIFAVIAAFLLHRLRSVLGTRHGDERQRPNPFTRNPQDKNAAEAAKVVDLHPDKMPARPAFDMAMAADVIDEAANADGQVEEGLREIVAADATFDPHGFVQGAQAAFGMVVTAFAEGDKDTLKGLLSPKLYSDFESAIKQREDAGNTMEFELHRIVKASVVKARLAGTMAYVTVDFDVEETTATRDKDGNLVDGAPDRIINVEDIWTFSRDTRSDDPNWTLIETRSAD